MRMSRPAAAGREVSQKRQPVAPGESTLLRILEVAGLDDLNARRLAALRWEGDLDERAGERLPAEGEGAPRAHGFNDSVECAIAPPNAYQS